MAAVAQADVETLAQLDGRDVAALTESMDVNHDDPDAADHQVAVYSSHMEDGTMVSEQYIVDPDAGICDCPDMLHRRPDGGCKHLRRVWFETGELALPPAIETGALAIGLRKHIDDGVSR